MYYNTYNKLRGLSKGWSCFPNICLNQVLEPLNFYFKVPHIPIVEHNNTNKIIQIKSLLRDIPIYDQIKLSFTWKVIVWGKIMLDVTHLFFKNMLLVQTEITLYFLKTLHAHYK